MKSKAITKPPSSPTLSFRIQLLLLPQEEGLPAAHEQTSVCVGRGQGGDVALASALWATN